MSSSLAVHNGDLFLSRGGFATVTNSSKLVQDLRLALLESRGFDDMHPEFGSLLDGGLDQYGNYVNSTIGETNWSFIAMTVEGEIRRVAKEHQVKQLQRSKNDRLTLGRSTLDPGELLLEIQSIRMVQAQDSLSVNVTLITGSDQEISLDIPITNQPIITN